MKFKDITNTTNVSESSSGSGSNRSVFDKHQIAIAKRTLQMNDVGANIMGGMTKAEARNILKKFNIKFKED